MVEQGFKHLTAVAAPALLLVVSVEPMPGFMLRLTFENGEVRLFAMREFLERASGVFIPLRNEERFREAYVAHGTVCWPGNVDIDPETLYVASVLV